MSHSSGGFIHLDDFNADVEEVGSDVEEVVTWDSKLCETKTFIDIDGTPPCSFFLRPES
jgi:hypothetical protein